MSEPITTDHLWELYERHNLKGITPGSVQYVDAKTAFFAGFGIALETVNMLSIWPPQDGADKVQALIAEKNNVLFKLAQKQAERKIGPAKDMTELSHAIDNFMAEQVSSYFCFAIPLDPIAATHVVIASRASCAAEFTALVEGIKRVPVLAQGKQCAVCFGLATIQNGDTFYCEEHNPQKS